MMGNRQNGSWDGWNQNSTPSNPCSHKYSAQNKVMFIEIGQQFELDLDPINKRGH